MNESFVLFFMFILSCPFGFRFGQLENNEKSAVETDITVRR